MALTFIRSNCVRHGHQEINDQIHNGMITDWQTAEKYCLYDWISFLFFAVFFVDQPVRNV